MPELPDVAVYVESLERMVAGRVLERVRIASPFVLRSFDPPIAEADGKTVRSVSRLGKRVVFALDDGLFLVVHLMIAGRFHWKPRGAKLAGKVNLASFDFDRGSLFLTEASPKKRASIHLVRDEAALSALSRGGIEPLDATPAEFDAALRSENHTLKRALTDPRLFSGIGNAYSDEILHAAKLSPVKLTGRLTEEESARLYEATRRTIALWIDRIREETAGGFPEKVTAFRKGMAVHGRFREPCPDCGGPVQRIVYAENEANYCPRCQTGGKLLADRALSKLMHDWPKTLEELEERKKG
ncbi:MAG TPA: DNA-formamidopyrimidine glycosylase family protein [Thermoanaerobaculia bacterium]|nr:DNA-formamidopyrimidine glycosylase family protein [Thermoanaerobaculia bacterium]